MQSYLEETQTHTHTYAHTHTQIPTKQLTLIMSVWYHPQESSPGTWREQPESTPDRVDHCRGLCKGCRLCDQWRRQKAHQHCQTSAGVQTFCHIRHVLFSLASL